MTTGFPAAFASWDNLQVVKGISAKNPIRPVGGVNYAKSINTSALVFVDLTTWYQPAIVPADFWPFGSLISFDFACTTEHYNSQGQQFEAPVPCNLTLTGGCFNLGNGYPFPTYDASTVTSFDLTDVKSVTWPFPASGMQNATGLGNYCTNYTFSAAATGPFEGSPVYLYLDNILFNHWWQIS